MEEVALKATAALEMAFRKFHGLKAVLESNKQRVRWNRAVAWKAEMRRVMEYKPQREKPLLPLQEKAAKEKDEEFSQSTASRFPLRED